MGKTKQSAFKVTLEPKGAAKKLPLRGPGEQRSHVRIVELLAEDKDEAKSIAEQQDREILAQYEQILELTDEQLDQMGILELPPAPTAMKVSKVEPVKG